MAGYELALKDFQQKNKLVSLNAQTEASVKAYVELKAKLIAAEVELSLLEKKYYRGRSEDEPQAQGSGGAEETTAQI